MVDFLECLRFFFIMWVCVVFAGVSASSSSSTSSGVISVGHMGNYAYGSVTMEKSFRVSDR